MDSLISIFFFLLIIPLYFVLTKKSPKRVPPGSLGFPVIGQSLSLLHAMRRNTAEKWLQERIRKYGPISKMNVFGTPTVFLHGSAANKFIYTCDSKVLANQQPASIRRLVGERNVLELSGHEHKRIRGALVSFLKPDVLKQYVGRMDEGIRNVIRTQWQGKDKILAMPFMKKLTFNIMSSLIIGIEQGSKRDELSQLFQQFVRGILSVPINLPFTTFNRSLKATKKIRKLLKELLDEKREALDQQKASPQQDLLSCLLTLRIDGDDSPVLSDDEIIDNAIVIILAGHDTTSILLTFLIRLLATNDSVRANIIQEQEEIAKGKAPGELLTWDDLARMKYTWRVAMETLRLTPPIIFSFRKVLQDFEYGGFLIPKGWQVMWGGFMTHMDDGLFPNASEFDPTRFESGSPVSYSYIPFGGGPRICPGTEFARIETLVAVHNLVTQFTWQLTSPEMSFSRDPLPSFKDGSEILVEPKINVNASY